MSTTKTRPSDTDPVPVRILWSLMCGNVVIGTGVMAVAGALNDISHSLHVSVAQAGQLVTAGAAVMGIGAPLLATLVASRDRRRLLALGVCQCSWNMSHAASSSLCTWITVVSFSGFSQTLPTGCQFRVLPDQRAGC